jgi:hypothetical protein
MELTGRIGLSLLQSGQANKEIIVNESFVLLDLLVGGSVEEPPRNTAPTSPAVGQAWIAGTAPTGIWAGKAGHVAGYTSAGWRLIPPAEGMALLVMSTGTFAIYRGGAWDVGEIRASVVKVGGQQVVGGQGAAIATPSGGSTVDTEARAAIAALLAALRAHGLIAT